MTDTCNAARCTKRMLAAAILKAIEEKIGSEAWEAMSAEERNEKYRIYRADCWQHLRNIMIEAMSQAGDTYMKELLSDSLELFSSIERIEPNASSVIRSAFKQFHHGGEYALGRGREFEAWRKKMFKTSLFIPFERAMGSRQDLKFDGCIPLFCNRLTCLEFLRGYIDCPKSQNILDKSLYTTLKCNEFVALLRVNVLWDLTFSEPFRWLAGKTGKLEKWSLYKMSEVLDGIESAMEKIKEDPSLLMDPNFDMFAKVAEELPEFKAWREEFFERMVLAEDGETNHAIYREVLREARAPTAGSGNDQATKVTLELAKQMAIRVLEKMRDPKIALADKLTSQNGVNSIGRRQDAHEATQGIDGTNDRSENKFAIADYVMRTYRGISVLNASGVVQQRSAHDFDRPLRIVSDRRKRKATTEQPKFEGGFFWRLSEELRSSLVDMARRELTSAVKMGQEEKQQHDEEKLSKREQAVQRQLNNAVEKYAEALELFDAWKSQKVMGATELDVALDGLSITKKLAEVRRQIEMRTIGLGWRHFEAKWTFFADERQHTLEMLKRMLLDDIIPYEITQSRLKQLPKEAQPPQLSVRQLKQLGTADADALRIEAKSLFNVATLLPKAEAARERREAAGVADRVEAQQPKRPPKFDTQLVGKRLEVCWPYKKEGKTVKIWASGTVKRIADGLTDKKSTRAKKILPAGALLWAWEADAEYEEPAGEEWLILLPQKWNRHVQYAWRFDPCELLPQGCAHPPPRAPLVDDCATDYGSEEEYIPSDDE